MGPLGDSSPGAAPNARRQARPRAGARDERRLLGVACTPLFGPAAPLTAGLPGPRWCPSRVCRWWGNTGSWPASRCVYLPRAEGAGVPCRPLHACASTSPMGAGVGGCSTSQRHPARRLSRVCRGQGHVCAPEWPAGGSPPGPVGTGQAGSRGCSGAEQGRAGDAQQPSLVPRSGSWARLTPGVRRPKESTKGKPANHDVCDPCGLRLHLLIVCVSVHCRSQCGGTLCTRAVPGKRKLPC